MPHANEILEKRAEPIARAVLGLLLSGPQWRHRRVETITPLSGTIVRRRVSVDYTVPPEFHDDLRMPVDPDEPGDDDQWVVPLGWLVRRPLVSFDLRDGSGTSVPLLLTDQIASITRDLLLLAAIEGDLDPGDADRADEAIDLAIAASAPQRPEDPAQLVARADGLGLGADFTSLVRLSSHGFLLLAVMPQIAGRQVTKWQTDEFRRPARTVLRRVFLDAQVPGINEAASTHVEADLPTALYAASFKLVDRRMVADPRADGAERPWMVPIPEGEREPSRNEERPRLVLQPVTSSQDPHVRADLLIHASDFLVPAFVLMVLAALIVGVGLAVGVQDLRPAQRSTAPSILLGTFSVGFGLFLRVEEHPFIRTLLSESRAALGATAVVLAVAAIPLALRLDRGWVLGAWIVAAIVIPIAGFLVLGTIMSLTRSGRKYG